MQNQSCICGARREQRNRRDQIHTQDSSKTKEHRSPPPQRMCRLSRPTCVDTSPTAHRPGTRHDAAGGTSKWRLSLLIWCLVYKHRTGKCFSFTLSLPFSLVASWEGWQRLITPTTLPMQMLTKLAVMLQNCEEALDSTLSVQQFTCSPPAGVIAQWRKKEKQEART